MVYHYQCSIHYYKTSNIVAGPICSATIVTVLTVVVDLMMSHVRHYTSCGRRVTSSEPPLLFVCCGGPCAPAHTMFYCSSDIFNFIVPWVYASHLIDKKYKLE
jgi:hypothetical protein